MLKIGMVGCGTIGTQLAKAVETRFRKSAKLAYVCDRDPAKARRLVRTLKFPPRQVSIGELLRLSDFVIEAASQDAARKILPAVFRYKKQAMILSVGGLIHSRSSARLSAQGCVFVPSGAVGGIDALLAARSGKIKKVTLLTRKPIRSLKDSEYWKRRKFRAERIRKPTVIFRGSAEQAVRWFPKNVNVAATLSLAGIGGRRTRVVIETSPTYRRNVHEIEVEGSFGKIRVKTENVPSPGNPRTSLLAVQSAVACLDKIFSSVKIGT